MKRTTMLGALALAIVATATTALPVLADGPVRATEEPTKMQLLDMCNRMSGAQCKFNPEGPLEYTTGQSTRVGQQDNCTGSNSTLVFEHSGTVGTKTSVGYTIGARSTLANVLELSISGSYGREWSTEEKVTSQLRQEVGPRTGVEAYAAPQLTRVSGRWTMNFPEPVGGHRYWWFDDTINGRTKGQAWAFTTKQVPTKNC